jgi:hypothetical protein
MRSGHARATSRSIRAGHPREKAPLRHFEHCADGIAAALTGIAADSGIAAVAEPAPTVG